jgi:U3 small nucleolar RNA-associated protein 5
LKACVERLGKGRGFEKRGGGRGGGLSGKEGGCVVAWIRGVLVERGSILMTVSSQCFCCRMRSKLIRNDVP